MQTRILTCSEQDMLEAARLLQAGELVAFPTETVYGLGANARDERAVRSIFAAKGRPADNPLIVHIYDLGQLNDLCHVPSGAEDLMKAFWPGPLTLLFPKKETVPSAVTAGLPTVAIRMPSHPAALSLLKTSGLPLAAPSANRSGRPSPTTVKHVLEDMDGYIPAVIDGGPCTVGVESTVLDICHDEPCILRPGGITREMLESVLKRKVKLADSILRPLRQNEVALSPGMRYKHYAPEGTVTLVEGDEKHVLAFMKSQIPEELARGRRACALCFSEHMAELKDCCPHDIGPKNDTAEIARRLFEILRDMDEEKMESIYSEVVPPEGVGLAVMNRLGRAAAFRKISV